MKQDRLIVSVPHTGTRFLKARLGWKDHVHTIGNYDRFGIMVKQYDGRVLIPLRHPQDVLVSWVTRQRHKQAYWLTQFAMAWAHIQHVYETAADVEVVEIEKHDYPGITDWTPVGNKDTKNPEMAKEAEYIAITPVFALPIVRERYKARPVKPRKGDRMTRHLY